MTIYKNGKLNYYRENGFGNYKNGKQEGEWKFYHENGKLRTIENFKNGKLISVQKISFPNYEIAKSVSCFSFFLEN